MSDHSCAKRGGNLSRRVGFCALTIVSFATAIPALQARAQEPEATPIGSTAESVIEAAHRLSPTLRAAALDTAGAAAKAEGADALDDPTITDNYEFYKDPGVFSGNAITVSQAFPLWGKLGLRRKAALHELDAARGRERATQDALDESVKTAFARYYMATRAIAVNGEVTLLARGLRNASALRYGTGQGDQPDVLRALGEETAARVEAARLAADRDTARAQLNALLARPTNAPLAEPSRLRPIPELPALPTLVERTHANNPTLAADAADVQAAQSRKVLADKAWYPDVTVGVGPLIQTNGRSTGVAATVGFNIPVPWGHEESQQKAAIAELGAARARFDSAMFDIEAALGDALARLTAAHQAELLIEREGLPQARAAMRSTFAAYAQGHADFTGVIDTQHGVHDLELKQLQAQLDEQTALAALERLVGGSL